MIALVATLAFAPGLAMADAKGCPKKAEKLKKDPCSNAGDKEAKCKEECGTDFKKWEESLDSFNEKITKCNALTGATCGVGSEGADKSNLKAMKKGADATGRAGACMGEKARLSHEVAGEQDKVCKKLAKSCKSYDPDAGKECQKSVDEAKKTAQENDKKKEELAKQEKKNDENAKKQDGGMPQIPQIPMPPPKEDKPEDPLAEKETPVEGTAPTIATSALEEKKGSASPSVGFGSTAPTDTSTTISTDGGGSYSGFSADRIPAGSDFQNETSGASVPPTGGAGLGGGGGGLNSSGSSSPGEAAAAEKAAESANPYEMQVGSGGRLGVPKGKSSGDSDSALDAAATASFSGDIAAATEGATGQAAEEEEEETGYTVFKMVKYRYSELKKKGNI